MNQRSFALFFTLLLSVGAQAVATDAIEAKDRPLKVMVDPGHGGTDSGAVNGSLREADLALQVARLLSEKLKTDKSFKVEMTRENNRNISLKERVEKTHKSQADLLVSIHANASSDAKAHGVELYFQNPLPADEESQFLAASENSTEVAEKDADTDSEEPTKKNDVHSILEDLNRQQRIRSSYKLSKNILFSWRKASGQKEAKALRQAPFYVVSKSKIPSVLVELGFVTHQKELEKLKDHKYQAQLAERIYNGIKLYKENVDKSGPATLQ